MISTTQQDLISVILDKVIAALKEHYNTDNPTFNITDSFEFAEEDDASSDDLIDSTDERASSAETDNCPITKERRIHEIMSRHIYDAAVEIKEKGISCVLHSDVRENDGGNVLWMTEYTVR